MTIIIFFILVSFSGFFSASETAFFTLHQSQVRLMTMQRKKGALMVARLKEHPQRLLITILIGNNIVNISAASLATIIAGDFFGSASLGIATGVTTFFILIFGEIMPKSIAITRSKEIALLFAQPLYVAYILFYPLTMLLIRLNKVFNRNASGKKRIGVTEAEIRVMARMGVENGAIDYWEREMIENIFRFDNVPVGDIMTPLYRVEMLNGSVPVDQIAHFVSQSGHSRFPVFDAKTEDIIGYIHTNTLMRILNSDERDRPVQDFKLDITVIDEDMKIERVFRAMKREKSHMYLVHRSGKKDEILGLVTFEDILEEIVGDIEDETDALDYT